LRLGSRSPKSFLAPRGPDGDEAARKGPRRALGEIFDDDVRHLLDEVLPESLSELFHAPVVSTRSPEPTTLRSATH
jgi:hypothetical protein